jgi:hypothetical protein
MFKYTETISFRVPKQDYDKARKLALKKTNKRKKVSIGDFAREKFFEGLDKEK